MMPNAEIESAAWRIEFMNWSRRMLKALDARKEIFEHHPFHHVQKV